MVHESVRAAMDNTNIIHRTHLRILFLGQPIVFQQGKLLHIFLHGEGLLRR